MLFTELREFLLAFIPLFVAIDAIGILPVFVGLTEGMEKNDRDALLTQAVIAAAILSLIFVSTGQLIFRFLGITEADFRIAGGIVLVIISVADLAFSNYRRKPKSTDGVGIVPIGIPLMVGPAALTTIIICLEAYGFFSTLFALTTNLLLVWVLFKQSHIVVALIGKAGARACGKVMSLFLAAIGVMMVRKGLSFFLGGQ